MASNDRPVFSRDQVEAYFNRLKLPERHRKFSITHLSTQEALEHLAVLQKYHLQAIPFENLSLHYSQHHSVTLNLDTLFKKVVLNPGRGGYCMENNALFGTFLRSLGYELYPAGARVHDGKMYSGWSHQVSLVTLGGQKYMVDVGFGPNGPILPHALSQSGPDNTSQTLAHILPAITRLAYKNLDGNTDPNQKLWVYQHRINDDSDWQDMYCFSELEFFARDFQLMNHYTATSPTSSFTQRIICSHLILGAGGGHGGAAGEEVVGVVILQNADLKLRLHGEVTERQDFNCEEDRLKALEEHFNIIFSIEEKEGIRSLTTEIKPPPSS